MNGGRTIFEPPELYIEAMEETGAKYRADKRILECARAWRFGCRRADGYGAPAAPDFTNAR